MLDNRIDIGTIVTRTFGSGVLHLLHVVISGSEVTIVAMTPFRELLGRRFVIEH